MVANMTGIKCVYLRDSLKFIANLMTRNHSVDIHKSLLFFKIKSNRHKLIGNSFLNYFCNYTLFLDISIILTKGKA